MDNFDPLMVPTGIIIGITAEPHYIEIINDTFNNIRHKGDLKEILEDSL
jgi:hypothetical protein